MHKSVKILAAIFIAVVYSQSIIAGVHASDSPPFILDVFLGWDSGASGYFTLNTRDLNTAIGVDTSAAFVLDTGGEASNMGSISGFVTNSINGNPVPNAVITATGGYSDNSDGTGYYEIANVPPGIGYIVTCSASGMQLLQQTGIQVTAGSSTTLNFSLQPLVSNVVLDYLFPDPNPVVSEIMAGGTLYRHYLIHEEGSPNSPAANIPVKLSTGEYFYSEQDGIVTIAVDDNYIGNGNPGSEEVFSIVEVNYQSIPVNERETFTARIIDREYSRSWKNSQYLRAGVSFIRVESGQGSEVELVELADDGFTGDELLVNRQQRAYVGAEASVSAGLNVGISNVNVGVSAGAGVEGGFAVITEDGYQFDYHSISDLEAVAQYILFADGNFSSLDNTLIDLLAWLEEWFTGQTTLEDAYKYDSKTLDAIGTANANAIIGATSIQNDVGLGVGANIGAEGHSTLNYTYYNDAPYNELSVGLTGIVSAGAFGGIVWQNPNPNHPATGEFDNKLGLQVSGGLTHGLELSALWDRNTNEWQKFNLTLSASEGFLESTESYYNYSITGDEAFTFLQNSIGFVNDITSMYQTGDNCSVSNSTFNDFLYNGFEGFYDLQVSAPSPPEITYSITESEITEIEGFPVTIGLSLTSALSAELGGGTSFKEFDKKLVEQGAWYKGKHLMLEQYIDNPHASYGFDTEYEDVVNNIVEMIPFEIKVAAFFLEILSFIFDDVEFDLGNGSSIYFTEGSLPAGLDTVNVASWGWWGADRSRLPSHLTPRVRDIRSRIRDDARSIYGMDYGVGGFYQFEPLETTLLDSVSLTIAYMDSEVVNIDESTLRMYWEDKDNHEWVLVGGEVDLTNNTVTAVIPALQVYTLAPTLPKGRFTMIPEPPSIPADSSTICTITSGTIYNNDNSIVNDGDLFTVSSSSGQITTADADTTISGIQIEASGGQISFNLIAWSIAYDAQITAMSVYGTAEADTSVDFTDDFIPEAPVGVTALGEDGSIFVSWSPNNEGDLAGYKVYYDTDESGAPYEGVGTIFSNPSPVTVGLDTSWTLTGLTNDTTYYIAVAAYDIEGNESDYSEEVVATPEAPPILPLTVNDLSIAIEGEEISLSWSPIYTNTVGDSIDVSHYTVYRSLDNPYFLPSIEDSIGFVLHPASVYVDSNAGVNSTGFYNVKAVIDGGMNLLNGIPDAKEVNRKLK